MLDVTKPLYDSDGNYQRFIMANAIRILTEHDSDYLTWEFNNLLNVWYHHAGNKLLTLMNR